MSYLAKSHSPPSLLSLLLLPLLLQQVQQGIERSNIEKERTKEKTEKKKITSKEPCLPKLSTNNQPEHGLRPDVSKIAAEAPYQRNGGDKALAASGEETKEDLRGNRLHAMSEAEVKGSFPGTKREWEELVPRPEGLY